MAIYFKSSKRQAEREPLLAGPAGPAERVFKKGEGLKEKLVRKMFELHLFGPFQQKTNLPGQNPANGPVFLAIFFLLFLRKLLVSEIIIFY